MYRPSLTYAVQLARQFHDTGNFSVSSCAFSYASSYSVDEKTGALVPASYVEIIERTVNPSAYLVSEILRRRGVEVRFIAVDLPKDARNAVPTLAVKVSERMAVILFQRDASFCVRRFGRVKELVHLYDQHFVISDTTGVALSEAISAAMRISVPDLMHASDPLHPEHFCYFCATELLLWWGNAGAIREYLTSLHERGTPEYVLACAYRVPLSVVQRFFECGKYVAVSHELNMRSV